MCSRRAHTPIRMICLGENRATVCWVASLAQTFGKGAANPYCVSGRCKPDSMLGNYSITDWPLSTPKATVLYRHTKAALVGPKRRCAMENIRRISYNTLPVDIEALIAMVQKEILRHSWSYFSINANAERKITVSGCPVCKVELTTTTQFVEHIANDVVPRTLRGY